MIERYLRWVGVGVDSDAERSIGRDARGGAVTMTYDELGRFAQLESTIEPPND